MMKLSPPDEPELLDGLWNWKEKVVLKEAGERVFGSNKRIGDEWIALPAEDWRLLSGVWIQPSLEIEALPSSVIS